MQEPSPKPSRVWLAALIVFAVALALRLVHLWALRSSFAGTELFSIPLVDAQHHWKEALAILDGDPPMRSGVPWKGPGYSYFLAGLAALFGRSLGAVRWGLAVLGSINCALLVLLARRVFNLRWSVLAGLLAATNGLLIVYDTEPYQPTLLITLSLGTLALLSGENDRPLNFLGAGLLLGLACLVHPAFLLPAVLLVIWAAPSRRRGAVVLTLGLAAVIAPVTWHNWTAHEERVLISWNGGVNLYVANHPTYDQRAGNSTYAWGRIVRAPQDAGFESVTARDRLYYQLTFKRALRYPLATLGVLAKKLAVFFSPVEYSSNFRIYDLRERSPLIAILLWRLGPLGVPWGLWAPAALIGLVVLLRWKEKLGILLAVWGLGVLLANILVFSTARYRAPLVFFGCIWVAAALGAAWELWSTEQRRRLAVGGAVYAALVLVLVLVAIPQHRLPPPHEWYQALALTPGDSFEEAADWAERALDRDPESPYMLFFVSDFYARWDKRERQRDYLERLLGLPDLEPDAVDLAHERLASSYFAQRRLDEARAELLEAVAVGVDDSEWHGYPHYPLGLGPIRVCGLQLRLADLEIQRGEPAAAREWMDAVHENCPASPRFLMEQASLERRLTPLEQSRVTPRPAPRIDSGQLRIDDEEGAHQNVAVQQASFERDALADARAQTNHRVLR